jgi:hypothetical protein
MIPGLASVDPVLQIGKGALAVARKANAPSIWPNVYESLVELYLILDEWCKAATDSNKVITSRIMSRRVDVGVIATVVGGQGIQTASFTTRMMEDSEQILRPGAPWLQKWSKSKRRSAARRSLASILSVHAPGLVEAFDRATSERAEWVRWRQREFELWFDVKHSTAEEDSLLAEMRETLRRLEETRDAVGTFVNDNFPLGWRSQSQ